MATASPSIEKPSGAILAVRCHDVTVSLADKQVGDFDQLIVLGMAVRLALHLRGVEAVTYETLRQVGLHLLHIPPTTLPVVIDLLAEVEFIKVDREGKTVKSIVPTVPYYEDLFEGIGELADTRGISEPEWLTLAMVERLSKAPTPKDTFYNVGAEKKLVNKMMSIGSEGGYMIGKRARGRDILLAPMYFGENADAFADLSAGSGSGNVAKVVGALAKNQGWPLAVAQKEGRIGETVLTKEQLKIVAALAGDGFVPPPAIKTTHSGTNHFLFSPKPGLGKVSPTKRSVYETAMALVAAVRQGQFLPARFRIWDPLALLTALRDRTYIRANSEALEQYQKLVVLRLGCLVPAGGRAQFQLIDNRENREAVNLAIKMIKGEAPAPTVNEQVTLAFRKGETYVESLVGRQMFKQANQVKLDSESQDEIDNLLLKGMA